MYICGLSSSSGWLPGMKEYKFHKTPNYTQSLLELLNIYKYILYKEECLSSIQTHEYHCWEKKVFDPEDELVHPKQNVLLWKQFVGMVVME